mmetsp:Transcript_26244/g.57718  ORF Transcript_26244/g.57718 Transcript_26244/m.57718 type:complete len:219 (+) Transcript_26244:193-849(+)
MLAAPAPQLRGDTANPVVVGPPALPEVRSEPVQRGLQGCFRDLGAARPLLLQLVWHLHTSRMNSGEPWTATAAKALPPRKTSLPCAAEEGPPWVAAAAVGLKLAVLALPAVAPCPNRCQASNVPARPIRSEGSRRRPSRRLSRRLPRSRSVARHPRNSAVLSSLHLWSDLIVGPARGSCQCSDHLQATTMLTRENCREHRTQRGPTYHVQTAPASAVS